MPELSRREFLHAVAASTVGAVVFTGCQPAKREGNIESRVLLAEDTASANENWYATTCRRCAAGCGLIVRVVEGRAKKAEGNPDHPVNRGKLCARGQAVVQAQYHPDRIRGPLQRSSARGSAAFAPIEWDAALDQLGARLQGGRTVLITPPLRATGAVIVEQFTRAVGAQWLTLDVTGEAPLRAAMQQVFGQSMLPDLDLETADLVLSFGADFLGTWLSPVRYGRQYGEFRQGARARGYLVSLEPRFSLTAAAADEWIPTRPGTEGLLAQSLAAAIRDPASVLDTEAVTGVSLDRVRQLAERFANAQRPLAIGGSSVGAQTNGTQTLATILALNTLASSPALIFAAPHPLGLPVGSAPATLSRWEQLRLDDFDAVLVWNANPAYALPSAIGFESKLREFAGAIVSFSSLMDETTSLADVVLPTHMPLEDWGDDVPEPAPSQATWSLQQPLVRPLHDTRGFFDILLTLADLPWPTFKDALRETARRLPHTNFERHWTTQLQQGGWFEPPATAVQPGGRFDPTASASVPLALSTPADSSGWWPSEATASVLFDGDPTSYPFHLLVFEHHTLGAGEGAPLPWLQATPDPLTSVAWQTWVEVNPSVARQRGLKEGDIVGLESTHGRIELPVYVHPAAPPDILAVPMGQGHRFGRWASNRGANPMQLVAPLIDKGSGALAYAATRVRMVPTGRRVGLPKLEGTVPAYQLPDHEVVKVTRG